MSAFSDRTHGTAGKATTTVFFGAVPDKYTMLLPLYFFNTGGGAGNNKTQLLNMNAARRIDSWVPWDSNWGGGGGSNITASVGAATTAPDGTNTAFHITENSSTNYHVMVAGTDDFGCLAPVTVRLAVFAKAAERTRCWLEICEALGMNAGGNQVETGIVCVFDLSGGQIGVAPTYFSNGTQPQFNFVAKNSGIIPYGLGWYLCYLDVTLPNNGSGLGGNPSALHVLQAAVGIDSGSGTGAISRNYAGNGTSGINVWNTVLLPMRAWAINTVTLFDDFPNLNSIDVNNNLPQGGPGAAIKWYVAGATWPQISAPNHVFGFQTPIPPGTLSVSSSVLTVPAQPGVFPIIAELTSAAYNGAGGYVGYGPRAPWLLEWNGKYDYGVNGNTQELAWWALPIDWLLDPNSGFSGTAPNGNASGNYQEIDTVVNSSATDGEYNLLAVLDIPSQGGVGVASDTQLQASAPTVAALWNSGISYNTSSDSLAVSGGVLYQSLINGNLGNMPPSAQWTAITPATPPNPTFANSFVIDYTQFHTYGTLRIPDHSKYPPFDDCGCMMTFRDGVYCFGGSGPPLNLAGSFAYGATLTPVGNFTFNTWAQRADFVREMLIIQPSRDRNIYTDFVRVMEQV